MAKNTLTNSPNYDIMSHNNKDGFEMDYILRIKPAIIPAKRHKIEDTLKKMGYHIIGGGTNKDMSICDISFEGPRDEK